jgi:hypothetical protein
LGLSVPPNQGGQLRKSPNVSRRGP